MVRLSKSAMAVGGAVLAAGLIGFTNPKTVHALAAALVQVTNTATNPVVTAEVSRTAAQTVSLYMGQNNDGSRTPFLEMIPGGGVNSDAYVVPDGESLVITEIDIQARNAGFFQLTPVTTGSSGMNFNQLFEVPDDSATHQFLFPNGIVWPSGHNVPYSATAGIGQVVLRGYLTRS
jgi:hypothetical protein